MPAWLNESSAAMYPLVCHALMLCFNDKTGDSKAINAERTLCDRRTVA